VSGGGSGGCPRQTAEGGDLPDLMGHYKRGPHSGTRLVQVLGQRLRVIEWVVATSAQHRVRLAVVRVPKEVNFEIPLRVF